MNRNGVIGPPLSRRATLSALFGLGVIACTDPAVSTPAADPADQRRQTIYVTNIGWHTGIAVPRDVILATGRVPEIAAFPDAAYVEFGWGDRDYYTSADPSVFQALAAGLSPTPSVLHLIGMSVPPQRFYVEVEVLAVPASEGMLDRLIAHVDAEFDRQGGQTATPVPSALVRGAFFYPAKDEFHLFNTCNTWVARTLAEAGVDVSPRGVITADDLMARLRDVPGIRPAG